MMRRIVTIGLVGILCLTHNAFADLPLQFNADASLIHDSNVTKAEEAGSIHEDQFLELFGSASVSRTLSPQVILRLLGDIGTLKAFEYDKLDAIWATATLGLGLRFGEGFFAPDLGIAFSVTEMNVDSDIRDSTLWDLELSALQRLTDRLSVTGGIGATDRESEGEVFDNKSWRLFADLSFRPHERLTLHGGYKYLNGDIVSSAEPTLKIINAAEAIERDDAFDGLFAYRLDAHTHILDIGLGYSINERHTLNGTLEYLYSDAAGGNDYDRVRILLSYQLAF